MASSVLTLISRSPMEDYKILKKEFIQHFLARRYPYKIIIKAIEDIDKKNNKTSSRKETNVSIHNTI